MPLFTNHVPDEAAEYPYHLKRTPPKGNLIAIATSRQLIGTYTHYWHNRTRPCEEPDACMACLEGQQKRFHLYLTAIDQTTSEHFILELTAAASDSFRNYANAVGTIRGCLFKLYRPSNKANGRITALCKSADLTKITLPPAPDVTKLLCHIWNVPDQIYEPTPEPKDQTGTPTREAADTGLVNKLAKRIADDARPPGNNHHD